MMFSSKSGHDLNHDAYPWQDRTGRYSTDDAGWAGFERTNAPRPEFDHVQHNQPNPFLVAARKAHAAGATYADLRDDLAGYQVGYPGADFIDAVYETGYRRSSEDHGLLVLTRLAKIGRLHA